MSAGRPALVFSVNLIPVVSMLFMGHHCVSVIRYTWDSSVTTPMPRIHLLEAKYIRYPQGIHYTRSSVKLTPYPQLTRNNLFSVILTPYVSCEPYYLIRPADSSKKLRSVNLSKAA